MPMPCDDFMSPPKIIETMDFEETTKLPRKTLSYEVRDAPFMLSPTEHSQQFYKIYGDRLRRLRPVILHKINNIMLKEQEIVKIQEKILDTQQEETCFIIGAIIKEMPLKPNVLEEYAKERAILPVPPRDSYVSDKDCVYLEDETGRTKLQGIAFQAKNFLTGMVVAIKGRGIEDGDFEVHDIIEPGFAPQRPLPQRISGNYVALVSGLNVGMDNVNPIYLELLVDYLSGHIGSMMEHELQARVVRLILAGDSIHTENEELLNDQNRRFSKKEQSLLTQNVRDLDRYLLALCGSLPVDIMPGEADPSNLTLPQQPLNKCLLPKSSRLDTLYRATNPHAFMIDGVSFLGHSGQLLSNISKYMDITSLLDFSEQLLKWRHLSPSSPDLIFGFPLSNDPFIIEETPHVFFIGNQPKFETKLVKGDLGQVVRIVLLPPFASSGTFALVNIDTLSCHPVIFSTYDQENGME